MSNHLRRRLKKVLTPAATGIIRVADGRSPAVIGMCTARITIAGHHISVLFTVLEQCPNDVILGLDFLSAHAALIDCATGVLQLELPQLADVPDLPSHRLCSVDYVRLSPQAATCVAMTTASPVPDGDYIVSPLVEVLLTRNIAVPHTLVTVVDNHVQLPLLNFSNSTQALPQGISVANVYALDDCEVAALDADTCSSFLASGPASPLPDEITTMIAPDLPTCQAAELHHLLATYRDIFDFDDRPLGQTSLVSHRIHTGDAIPIRRRPYRVSHSERQVIQREVDKVLSKDVIDVSSSP